MKPNRSRSGFGSSPERVVAPTSVNGDRSSGMLVAPAPLPTMMSMRKSSIARYSISSARPRHPVDLVDEQHLAGHQARQQGGQIAGVLDGGAARHAQRPVALVGDDHRERRLAESRRTGEQDVVGRAVLHRGRVEQQLQLPAHLHLADELRERARSQRTLERELGLRLGGRGDETLGVVGARARR